MASSSKEGCGNCYAGLKDSPECCLKNQRKPGKGLRLAKIECALKDQLTSSEFKVYFDERGNYRNMVLIDIYRRLYEFEVSGNPIQRFREVLNAINTIITDNDDGEDYFEQGLQEEFQRVIAKRKINDAELDGLKKKISDYITDELQDGFTKFVQYICCEKFKW